MGLKGNISKFFAWILVLIVIVSLAGFGIQDVILGSTSRNIATVGKEKVSIDEFVRNLDNEIARFSQKNNLNLTIEDAKAYGLVNKVLNDLIAKKIFDNFLKQNEISRGDDSVAEFIKTVDSFNGITGEFDIERYKRFVAASGLSIKEFENNIKSDLSRDLILNIFAAPKQIDPLIFEKLVEHYFQSREIALVELDEKTFKNKASIPSESDISEYFEKNQDDFVSPRKTIIEVAKVDFDQIIETQTVDDREIETYYRENPNAFQVEEKRLIDKLSFESDGEKTDKRISQILAKPILFDEEISIRGLKIDDITLGLVTESDGDKNFGDLFRKKDIGIYGPYQTDLGTALYRINQIIPEKKISYLEAKKDIKKFLASDKAKEASFELLEKLNNDIAAGQTIDDLKLEFMLSVETLEIEDDILPEKFRETPLVTDLYKNSTEEISEFTMLSNGSLIAIKLIKDVEARNLNLEEASKKIKNILTQKNILIATKVFFDKKIGSRDDFLNELFRLNNESEIFVEIKKKKIYRFNLNNQLTLERMKKLFMGKKNDFFVFFDDSRLFVAFIEKIKPDDIGEEQKRTLIAQRIEFYKDNLKQNFINNYLNFIKQTTEISVNEKLIESTLLNLRRNS